MSHSESRALLKLAVYSEKIYGAEGSRTPDLLNAIQTFSQLNYSPKNSGRIYRHRAYSQDNFTLEQSTESTGLIGRDFHHWQSRQRP